MVSTRHRRAALLALLCIYSASVLGRQFTVEHGELPFMARIGVVGRDEQGQEQYGIITEDGDYDFPAKVTIDGEAQNGLIIVRQGMRVLRYHEDEIDLESLPQAEVLAFPSESRWMATAPASSDRPGVLRIQAQRGYYIEALLTDQGGVYPLNLSKGTQGIIVRTNGAVLPVIPGTQYASGRDVLVETPWGAHIKIVEGRRPLGWIAIAGALALGVSLSVTLAVFVRRLRRGRIVAEMKEP